MDEIMIALGYIILIAVNIKIAYSTVYPLAYERGKQEAMVYCKSVWKEEK